MARTGVDRGAHLTLERPPEPSASSSKPRRLGPALLRAWLGYRRRLDEALAAAGFDRRFPDGRVLHICARTPDVTISQIARELGMSRQGAGKIVASLHDREYVALRASASDSREKIVALTPRAQDFLAARRKAARAIERSLRAALGSEAFEALECLLTALGGDEQPRLSAYLRRTASVSHLLDAEE